MSIKLNNTITITGVLSIDSDGRIIISVEEMGDIPLNELLEDFDGREVALSVSCEDTQLMVNR